MTLKEYRPPYLYVLTFQFPDGREITSPLPEGYTLEKDNVQPAEHSDWCFVHVHKYKKSTGSLYIKSVLETRTLWMGHPEIQCWFIDMGPVLESNHARVLYYKKFLKDKEEK